MPIRSVKLFGLVLPRQLQVGPKIQSIVGWFFLIDNFVQPTNDIKNIQRTLGRKRFPTTPTEICCLMVMEAKPFRLRCWHLSSQAVCLFLLSPFLCLRPITLAQGPVTQIWPHLYLINLKRSHFYITSHSQDPRTENFNPASQGPCKNRDKDRTYMLQYGIMHSKQHLNLQIKHTSPVQIVKYWKKEYFNTHWKIKMSKGESWRRVHFYAQWCPEQRCDLKGCGNEEQMARKHKACLAFLVTPEQLDPLQLQVASLPVSDELVERMGPREHTGFPRQPWQQDAAVATSGVRIQSFPDL